MFADCTLEDSLRSESRLSQEELVAKFCRTLRLLDYIPADDPCYERLLEALDPIWNAIEPENRP